VTGLIDIYIPDIGDFSDVPIVEIPISVGSSVNVDDTLVAVESDKATLDVPAPIAGVITELLVSEGDNVSQGSLVARMRPTAPNDVKAPLGSEGQNEDPAPKQVRTPTPASARERAESSRPIGPLVYASPSVRQMARKLGVDVTAITGTGRKQRILPEDVEDFVKSQISSGQTKQNSTLGLPNDLPDWPTVDFAKFGPIDRQPLSRIARISGPALTRNALVIPHVCNFDKADVTDLEAFRTTLNAEATAQDTKISMLAFAVKSVVSALQAYPMFNSALDGDAVILRKYFNIGVAANTPDGLVVPVIRDAETKGVRMIAAEMADLAAKARAGKLSAENMSGATFTISSLGGIGGTGFTPIINAPEVAILGMTRADIQPVWDGDAFQPRLIQPLSLSWDHRVIDGVAAATFLQHISRSLSDFRRILV
jgi:pyruvate dehydrogenase E2 component (dihydrolipoyllysine-residue acetyltransferase)